ncbi:MAG: glycerophosphodiester phosphodiesterase family protein [Polaribacter sp.]|nr:glycerophosphodiester phosphodiesterase family protein [Polaribacter sp.]
MKIKMNNYNFILLFVLLSGLVACKNDQKTKNQKEMQGASEISEDAKKVRDYMKTDIVIAHRGSTYWAPEETEPAFLWARNIGADYLEFDIQLTKDSVLVAFHDSKLDRTSNVVTVFPERATAEINDFTLKELRRLDVGSWFNKSHPERAKEGYKNLTIMTLKDVVMIAEGYRIVKKDGTPVKEIVRDIWTGNYVYEKDPNDTGNRPGIYVETKSPKLHTEKILAREISNYGWNINTNPKEIKTMKGKVGIANTHARLVLQSFSTESIVKLEEYLPNIPKCLLLWQPDMKENLKENYKKAIQFSIQYNVQGIGPSIAGAPNNYEELTAPWMLALVHDAGMVVHPYTFDTNKQLEAYANRVEGVFTNRADLALEFYDRNTEKSSKEILLALGYN